MVVGVVVGCSSEFRPLPARRAASPPTSRSPQWHPLPRRSTPLAPRIACSTSTTHTHTHTHTHARTHPPPTHTPARALLARAPAGINVEGAGRQAPGHDGARPPGAQADGRHAEAGRDDDCGGKGRGRGQGGKVGGRLGGSGEAPCLLGARLCEHTSVRARVHNVHPFVCTCARTHTHTHTHTLAHTHIHTQTQTQTRQARAPRAHPSRRRRSSRWRGRPRARGP
jgi:hypothetical protein